MLQSTAEELQSLVLQVTPKLATVSETSSVLKNSPGKWSRKEILGHLIDSASNNHQRFVRSQLASPLRTEGYEQERWVATQTYQNESWNDILSLWRAYNIHLAHVIGTTPDSALRSIVQVGQSDPVTLEFLMKDYLRHLKHHLEQILETP